MKEIKKTYYGFYLDCVDGVLTFETKEEAEEARKEEIEQGDEPFVIWAEEQVNKSFAPNMISD